MRTREEQIASLAAAIYTGAAKMPHALKEAETYILEAEHRAEARVRAEIARDSERLDWLVAHSWYGIPGFDPVVFGRTRAERRVDLIRVIDAALGIQDE